MKFVKTFMIILVVTGLLVFFQNCSVQQNTGLLRTSASSASIADKIVTEAPFAYDLVVDTISYNSCVGENLNSRDGLFGLKIGVNEGFVDSTGAGSVKAGLKLRSDFLQYVGKNISPRYPSSVITPAQIQSVISNSVINKDTYLQIAVRKKEDLSIVPDVIQGASSAAVSIPRDGIIFYTPLFQDPVLTNLTKNVQFGPDGTILSEGSRIYNLQDAANAAPIEAAFGYSNIADETYPKVINVNDSENLGYGERYSETVRNSFNSSDPKRKFLLTVTYGAGATSADYGLNSPKRLDPLKKGNAYGRSYALQFGFPLDSVANGWKNTALKSVIESNLSDGTIVSGAAWTCENFFIMKKEHWNNSKLSQPACSPLTAADLVNASVASKVKTLRRHYTSSAWNVGFLYPANEVFGLVPRTNHKICLAPAVGGVECYLPTDTVIPNTDVGVNYNYKPATECYLYNRFGTTYTGSIDAIKADGRCAQFASVCLRASGNF